jgi:hypothetical protein
VAAPLTPTSETAIACTRRRLRGRRPRCQRRLFEKAARIGRGRQVDLVEPWKVDIVPTRHDAIRKLQVAPAAPLLADAERGRCLVLDVQALGVAFGRDEDVIVIVMHEGGKIGIQPDLGSSLHELPLAKVLEVALRAFEGVHPAM